jgi:hypothetical protein
VEVVRPEPAAARAQFAVVLDLVIYGRRRGRSKDSYGNESPRLDLKH